ncbi:hypothetical protein [Nocardia asteroides]|uniref:hypothetical protein n=1 Tax=Nocardia asteroides TaxID=1824 RepID=UPI001E5B6082|nr:hypothetical protein [Nocardia asteroides]UGT58802.1 hypothetical protein LTT85_33160 [Nocardia asteroides]
MGRPTQQEMFTHALEQLDAASNALSQTRSWLNADWDGLEVGVELPRPVGERRTRARTAITEAKTQIEQARRALDEALDHYDPAAAGLLDSSEGEIVDGRDDR